jgi:hypothetical protein
LTFDDPAVNDELSSTFSELRRPMSDGAVVDKMLNAEFPGLVTPHLSFEADATSIAS